MTDQIVDIGVVHVSSAPDSLGFYALRVLVETDNGSVEDMQIDLTYNQIMDNLVAWDQRGWLTDVEMTLPRPPPRKELSLKPWPKRRRHKSE